MEGERHIGWPSRLSSAQEAVQKFMYDIEMIDKMAE